MAPGNDGRLASAHPFTVLVGNPKPRSRTRQVVVRAAELLRVDLAAAGVVVTESQLVDLADLAELAPALTAAPAGECPAPVAGALAAVTRDGLLIMASPTYKGTFTGLLKLFVDLLPPQALRGTVALPLMTAASVEHRHAVESYLRPLLIALGATVPTRGMCVLEAQFGALDETLAPWSAGAARVLAGILAAPSPDRLLTRA